MNPFQEKLLNIFGSYEDFPKPGIVFCDILPVLRKPEIFNELINQMSNDSIIKDSEAIWSTLKASINSITPGDSLELEIIRNGQRQRVLIETTEIPARVLAP